MEYGGDIVLVLDMPKKRGCVGAIAVASVLRRPASLGGIGDDRSVRALDLGEAAPDADAAGRADGALEFVGERIVAAGVEHENAQVPGLLQVGEDIIHPRHAPQVRFIVQFGIDRNQIIDAGILHGMAAVIEHGDIGGTRRARKTDGGVLHAGLVEIGAEDGLEAGPPEGGGDVLGIVRWVRQMRHMDIGAVADHQRDSIVGAHRGSDGTKKQSHNDKKQCVVAHNPSREGGDELNIAISAQIWNVRRVTQGFGGF